jgi:uncharacterized protein (TIGR03503 family)
MVKRKSVQIGWLRLVAGLLLVAACSAQAAPAAAEKADARVLIDISGSMKQNDPQNLRRPALRMLVGLLPEDARAGVWTFGQYVNMLIPLGQIDTAWKDKARAEADQIASPGQFTNIEDVIKRSIADWEGPPGPYQRHLILLTDGVVDISKNPKLNVASRQRILEQLLPQLQAHAAQVHTIALSARADHELMQTLSRETGGWYEQVGDAEQLQRVFLRIFEKVGRPDTVPLKDNKFLVDSSIQEVTLLVFRKEGAEPTRIFTPSGAQFDAKSAPSNVSWHRDIGYDLLTVSHPETGEWRIQAAMDPDNRVIVVTDLKMRSSQLPSRFVLGEVLPVTVSFTNQGKQIIRQDFLDVVNLQSGHTDSNGGGEPRPIFDDGQDGDETAGDGKFTLQVGQGLAAGQVELVILAQGKTFQREQRQTFELADPVRLQVEAGQAGAELRVRVQPDGELLDLETLEFKANLVSQSGEEQPVMLLPGVEAGVQEARIATQELQGDWSLSVSVSGKTQAGSELDLTLDPVAVQGTAPPPTAPVEPVVEPPAEQEAPVSRTAVAHEPKPQAEAFTFQVAVFGVVNLVLIILVGLAVWMVRRGKKEAEFQLVEDDDQAVAEESTQ